MDDYTDNYDAYDNRTGDADELRTGGTDPYGAEGYSRDYGAYRGAYRDVYGGGSSEPEWGTVLAGTVLAVVGGYFLIQGVTGNARSRETSYRASYEQREDGREPADKGIEVTRSVTIGKPVGELYSYWRNLENLPEIMRHLETVTMTGVRSSHWVAKGPAGSKVEWDAETTEERENERLAWRSLPDADVQNEGEVRFREAPGDRGTEITVSLTYHPPGGALGVAVAKLFGREPYQQIGEDLNRFKQRQETGEIATIKGQPSGRD